jgi:hypothetical protein
MMTASLRKDRVVGVYPVVEAKLKGYTLPPCATCGAWALQVKVQESEEAPTGFRSWVECTKCGVGQDGEVA